MSDPRGTSRSVMRQATCKDCLREERALQLGLSADELPEDFDKEFVYNERAAAVKLERGQTRSDRCKRHRARHRINIQGMAVPYIDLQTIGEAIGAHDENGPTGPFGGLGPMPEAHRIAQNTEYNLSEANVGMTDQDILDMLAKLKHKRILVAKAGTGTGKSTFMPYRLLDPPEGASFRLASLGPIIVTEPRVQATTGVAWYVGTVLSGAGGVGPGYPVGFQVSGNKAHDDSCQLVYVTDGTMINWLREGRLSTIGTVIVDEAHERSTNIDFIMGYLKKAIDRYPHLRVIITSATFDEYFYQEYFGGPEKVEIHVVPAVKSIGYGFPLFPDLDESSPSGEDLTDPWEKAVGSDLPLRPTSNPADDEFVAKHFQPLAPPLKKLEVAADYPDPSTGAGWAEDLHDTTRRLVPLRFEPGKYGASEASVDRWKRDWANKAPRVLGEYIVDLVQGLDAAGIYGDVLGFLPTTKNIEEAVGIIKAGLGIRGEHGEQGDVATVYPLISSLPTNVKENALRAQVKGNTRKIVVSTNLAETSLTVEGVRFVVDSGLIAQDEWNPQTAQGGVQRSLHSQAGIRQRWGRVGRKSPGWAFPLYTKEQFLSLAPDTAPGSTRSNLENLIMTAKLGGIDDVVGFDWPAKFWPKTWPQTDGIRPDDEGIAGTSYEPAARSRQIFLEELLRADSALRSAGAVDLAGDPTSFGKSLSRAPTLGTEASKIALMHADRLACVPEVATILKLLDNTNLVGDNGLLLSNRDWPAEWQLEAAERHRALASGCSDDAELVLQIMAVWERSDSDAPPAWERSRHREDWAGRWWINHDLLLKAAEARHEVLVTLSSAMKEDVKRFVEPALVRRARGAITRALASLEYRQGADGKYESSTHDGLNAVAGVIDHASLFPKAGARIIPLKRNKQEGRNDAYLSNIVSVEEWALPDPTDGRNGGSGAQVGSLDLLVKASKFARPESGRSLLAELQALWPSGMRAALTFESRHDGIFVADDPTSSVMPSALPQDVTDNATADQDVDSLEVDADGGPDTSWPSPIDPEPENDLDIETQLILDFMAGDGDFLEACRVCTACLAGNLAECSDPVVPRDESSDESRVASDLEERLRRAWSKPEVARPKIASGDSGDAAVTDGSWYEIADYCVEGAVPSLRIRAAWRQDGIDTRLGHHDGLQDGDVVELEVGPERTGHRGNLYRTFYRVDGDSRTGRFVLPVTASSDQLQEGHRVEGRVAHRGTGAASGLTFVPHDRHLGLRIDLPKLSLDEARAKYHIGTTFPMVVTNVHDNGGQAWLETADGTGAYIHKSNVGPSGVLHLRDAVSSGDEVTAEILTVTEHKPGEVQLRVALREIKAPPAARTTAEVASLYPRGVEVTAHVTNIATDGNRAWLVTDDGIGAMALKKEAGPSGLADLNVAMARGDVVTARVLSVGEHNGKVQINVALPALAGPSRAEAAAEAHPVGSRSGFRVTSVLPNGRRAFLKTPDGVSATISVDKFGRGGLLTLGAALSPGDEVEATVIEVNERNGEPQLQLAMHDFPVPAVDDQLTALGVVRGAILDGVVQHVAEYGVFVALGPVSGLVHKSRLPGGSSVGFTKGAAQRVRVLDAGEDPRKVGAVKVSLDLA